MFSGRGNNFRQRPEAGKILGVLANFIGLEHEGHLGKTWLIKQGVNRMLRPWDSCRGHREPGGVLAREGTGGWEWQMLSGPMQRLRVDGGSRELGLARGLEVRRGQF